MCSVITNLEVSEILSARIPELINTISECLRDYSLQDPSLVQQPLRTSISTDSGFFLAMPGYWRRAGCYACKLLTCVPDNASRGLPSIQGCLALFNESDGRMLAVMEAEELTALRTAAASAVATQLLANPDSGVLALIGTGKQAWSHFLVLSSIYRFKQVALYNPNVDSASQLKSRIAAHSPSLPVAIAPSVHQAVAQADIVCMVSLATAPLLTPDTPLRQGVHVNAVDAPRPDQATLHPQLVTSSAVFADSLESASKEAGCVVMAGGAHITCEVGQLSRRVVSGECADSELEGFRSQRTMFVSLGIALEDVAAAKLVYDLKSSSSGAT